VLRARPASDSCLDHPEVIPNCIEPLFLLLGTDNLMVSQCFSSVYLQLRDKDIQAILWSIPMEMDAPGCFLEFFFRDRHLKYIFDIDYQQKFVYNNAT
jgi:hypothetical protein